MVIEYTDSIPSKIKDGAYNTKSKWGPGIRVVKIINDKIVEIDGDTTVQKYYMSTYFFFQVNDLLDEVKVE